MASLLALSLTACPPPKKKGDRPWWAASPSGSKAKTKKKAKPASKKSQPAARPAAKPAAAPVNAEAQQAAYDRGMKHYTDENYAEAQTAWKESIRLGPNTPLADQARENIKKTDQILKTLQEMKK